MDFNKLITNDQKKDIILKRMSQFAADAYQLQLSKKTAEAIGSVEQVAKIDATLTMLESAIKVHQAELDNLN